MIVHPLHTVFTQLFNRDLSHIICRYLSRVIRENSFNNHKYVQIFNDQFCGNYIKWQSLTSPRSLTRVDECFLNKRHGISVWFAPIIHFNADFWLDNWKNDMKHGLVLTQKGDDNFGEFELTQYDHGRPHYFFEKDLIKPRIIRKLNRKVQKLQNKYKDPHELYF